MIYILITLLLKQYYSLHDIIFYGMGMLTLKEVGEYLLQIIYGTSWLHDNLIFHSYLNPM